MTVAVLRVKEHGDFISQIEGCTRRVHILYIYPQKWSRTGNLLISVFDVLATYKALSGGLGVSPVVCPHCT